MACASVVSWEWLDGNPAVANALMVGGRRRDPEGFAAFCAGVILAKVAHWDAKAEGRPRHGERAADSDRVAAAVRDRFGGGN